MASSIPANFTPDNILLIKLRHHGDMLLTTPVINALRQRYPQANIDVLLYQETRPMLQANPDIRQLHVIDRKWKQEGARKKLAHEWALLKRVRASRYDVVINLADQWRSAIITLFSGAPVRIGFDYKKRDNAFWRLCHTHRVSTAEHGKLHTVEQNLSALAPLGILARDTVASMHYEADDWPQTAALLAGLDVSDSFIVIQPTSRWIFKCWDDEKVAAVIDRLARADRKIVLTAAPDKNELAMIDNILAHCKTPHVVSVAGKLSLTKLAALIDHAVLFIGVDSAPMHMAAALDTPCLALFGPTKLQHWRPWGFNNRVIWAGDYGPLPAPDSIDTKTQQRYLTTIPVEDVLVAARKLLNE